MKITIKKITIMAVLLAIGYVLPLLTANIPTIGRVLSPLYYPVFICGLILGPVEGLVLGFVLPLTRTFIFGTPEFPLNIVMSFELATYGFISGLLLDKISTKYKLLDIFLAIIISLFIGKLVWGLGRTILSILIGENFTLSMFLTIGFINAIPGIIIQLIILPILIRVLLNLSYVKLLKKEDK